MTRSCICGQTAAPGDKECSLCGRELPQPSLSGSEPMRRPETVEPEPAEPAAPTVVSGDRSSSPRQPARRGTPIVPALLGAIVALLLVGGIFLFLDRRNPTASPPHDGTASSASAAPATPESEFPTEPTGVSVEPTPSPSITEPEPWSPMDPPTRAEDAVDATMVVSDAPGTACRSSTGELFGGYPAASCDLWKTPRGLLHNQQIDKGAKRVACQRDLGITNPKYLEKQSNTWWIWSRSESGTWDWYPETAIKQGASDQPVNGVAICH